MTKWECALCGHTTDSDDLPIKIWDDGHVCVMIPTNKLKTDREIQEDYEAWLDYRATQDDNIHAGDK